MGNWKRTRPSRGSNIVVPWVTGFYSWDRIIEKGGNILHRAVTLIQKCCTLYNRPLSCTSDTYQHTNALWVVSLRTRSKPQEVDDSSCFLHNNVGGQQPRADEVNCYSVMIEMEQHDPAKHILASTLLVRAWRRSSYRGPCRTLVDKLMVKISDRGWHLGWNLEWTSIVPDGSRN